MTSPNTLERMARAIYAGKFHAPADEMTDAPEFIQAGCFDTARAVLEALKTVDDSTVEAMAKAVYRARYGSDEGWPNESEAFRASIAEVAKPAFTAAIDHILNQGAEG